jgi:hypothetical protein
LIVSWESPGFILPEFSTFVLYDFRGSLPLEIQWADKIDFIEVKSVTNLGDSFSMTNNEYSTSVEYGDNYYLGIVEQNLDGLKICFIQNPIKTITLLKRVTRWEWVCNEYSGILINTGQNKL